MRFRLATSQDKEYVLNFCKNTFSWGDYIDRVWDIWISEPNSILLVAEIENRIKEKKPIAIAHGILIPEKTIWIEGIRVNQEYRKQKLATNLINHIVEYGRKREAVYSAAIVSVNNEASKIVMKKSGFEVISKWSYISNDQMLLPNSNLIANFKIADSNDYQQIINFLKKSNIFRTSGKKFVKSWRWYDLTNDRLLTMIYNKQVIIVGKNDDNDHNNNGDENNDKDKLLQIRGIAIIDREGYWNNQNIFQIVYIDADSEDLLLFLVNKSLKLTLKQNEKYSNKKNKNKYERIQIFSPYREYISRIFTKSKSNIIFSEQFLLYYKRI
ncbi:MAG TPA: GNAT family N-acetyltransferase [Nitrososphaeraceae archaeon]|nr:GNAT family N-acetyltransferase [Nitrososphaeraceae archaeon]